MVLPERRLGIARYLPEWLCPYLALILIAATAVLHLAYLAWDCPLDLAPDEAHYWDWSRHLDWSYYSKGPLVAWLIRASCELFGPWSEQHTGSLTFAIRLPAVACGSLLLIALYQLTVQVFGRARLALAVVAVALTLPLITAGRSLMTIDSPYTCCWCWALVFAHQAIIRRSSWAWEATGGDGVPGYPRQVHDGGVRALSDAFPAHESRASSSAVLGRLLEHAGHREPGLVAHSHLELTA